MHEDRKRRHVFLSHASADQQIANKLQELIELVSLNSVGVWFSSDGKPTGGIAPGDWRDQIKRRLRAAKLVVALLTPESLNRPWIAFECGFGAAVANGKVIPVTLGLDTAGGIPMPLNMFQVYQLTDIRSVNEFLSKLLNEFDIKYDPAMAGVYVKPAVEIFLSLIPDRQTRPSNSANRSDSRLIQEIKSYLDQALLNNNFMPGFQTSWRPTRSRFGTPSPSLRPTTISL
jgi:TIR domain